MTTPQVGYYGDLDPIGTGIAARRSNLPRVVEELLLFLLVKDVVVVPHGALLEHGLTLPAFEALTPFVRAGRLTTSTGANEPTPAAFIDQRASLYLESLHKAARRTIDRSRRCEILEVVNRWRALMPEQWTITRDVDVQIAAFSTRILRFCKSHPHPSEATQGLARALEDMMLAGHEPNRHSILAEIAALRSVASPREIARLVFVVQSQFFAMGTEIHDGCTFHPGTFAQAIRDNGMTDANVLPMPSTAWLAEPRRVRERLRDLGIDPDRLLALPMNVISSMVTSVHWPRLRSLLVSETRNVETERAIAAAFRRHGDASDALDDLTHVMDTSLLPAPLPAPWQLAVQTILNISAPDEPRVEEDVVLDLRTLTLSGPRRSDRPIRRACAALLTALTAVGEVGLSVMDIKQLSLDVDRIEAAEAGSFMGPWMLQSREAACLDESRSDRLKVLKSRSNQHLLPFGLQIRPLGNKEAGRRWVLVDVESGGRHLHLRGTLWDLLGAAHPLAPPAGLSTQQAATWNVLAEAAPYPVTVANLARQMKKPHDEAGLKQVTDALDRLARKLSSIKAPFRVVRVQRGLYILLPGPPPLPSEVR